MKNDFFNLMFSAVLGGFIGSSIFGVIHNTTYKNLIWWIAIFALVGSTIICWRKCK